MNVVNVVERLKAEREAAKASASAAKASASAEFETARAAGVAAGRVWAEGASEADLRFAVRCARPAPNGMPIDPRAKESRLVGAGHGDRVRDQAFVAGFFFGAAEVWNQVKDQL